MNVKKTLIGLALLLPAALLQAHEHGHAHGSEQGAEHQHPAAADGLQIDQPWSRAMPPVAPTAAAYFVVRNSGEQADRLVGASTPVAGRAELHEHVHADGVMKMQHVAGVDIPAGGEVRFDPMGYHVMLFDLQRQAADGERFPLTLRFEKGGEQQVEVQVRKDAPAGGNAHPHHH